MRCCGELLFIQVPSLTLTTYMNFYRGCLPNKGCYIQPRGYNCKDPLYSLGSVVQLVEELFDLWSTSYVQLVNKFRPFLSR